MASINEVEYQPIQDMYLKSVSITKNVYNQLGIHNSIIENGAEILNEFSEPLVVICSEFIDPKLINAYKMIKPYTDQLEQKRQGLIKYIPTKTEIQSFMDYSTEWIKQNTPFKVGIVIDWEEFKGKFKNLDTQQTEQLKFFYEKASELWLQLKKPDFIEVTQIILDATAYSITKTVNLAEGVQSKLFQILQNLGSRILQIKEKITKKQFVEDVQQQLGSLYQDSLKPSITSYYMYLIQLVQQARQVSEQEQNRIRRYVNTIRDISLEKFEQLVDFVNSVIQKYKKNYYLEGLDELESIQEESDIQKRVKMKLFWFGDSAWELTKYYAENNQMLQEIDKQMQIVKKSQQVINLVKIYNTKFNIHIYQPVIKWISISKSITNKYVKYYISFLEPLELLSDIEFLKFGSSMLIQYPVYILNTKIIVLFDKERLKEYGEVFQQEINKFVQGILHFIRTLEIQNDSWNLYHNVISRINSINTKYNQLQLQKDVTTNQKKHSFLTSESSNNKSDQQEEQGPSQEQERKVKQFQEEQAQQIENLSREHELQK